MWSWVMPWRILVHTITPPLWLLLTALQCWLFCTTIYTLFVGGTNRARLSGEPFCDPWFGSVSFCSWSNWSNDCYWGGKHSERFLPIGTRAANSKQASAHYNLHAVLIIQPSRGSDRDLRELWSDWGMPELGKVFKKGSKKTAPRAFKSSKRKRRSRRESYSICM